jgi:tight adherence protein B
MSAFTVAFVAGVLGIAMVAAIWLAFTPASTPNFVDVGARMQSSARLVLGALLVAFVVLAVTRWPVAAVAAGVFVGSWRWLFGTSQNRRDRAVIEAVAQWLEDLRDVVRRSSVAIETAIDLVAEDTSGVLAEPMAQFLRRRRQGRRLPEALAGLADDIGHPTADAAVAALVLVVGGGAGGGRVFDTLDELSMAARDEMCARDEIDRTRRVFERAMRRLVVLTVLFVTGLVVFAPDLLAPYQSLAGQIWLLIPVGLWAFCLVSLRRLMRYNLGARYRLRTPDEVAA